MSCTNIYERFNDKMSSYYSSVQKVTKFFIIKAQIYPKINCLIHSLSICKNDYEGLFPLSKFLCKKKYFEVAVFPVIRLFCSKLHFAWQLFFGMSWTLI